ncbi:hypothetical protein [Nesterenkonia lutea]|uniref:Fatty acid desaturase n=1 Tax=Nesterenkonia lutea TaxID=272919 RepID=A0ABR9JFB7_9MICC|nr:hypothetical protein [Nesterenkonia lutea]MBE1524627.1 fatty acid desaturase [Nesterenkonia lutea]
MTRTRAMPTVAGHTRRASPHRPPGHDYARGAVRFVVEIIAWIATAWALWPHSILLAIAAVAVLVALPAVFGTPGDRPGGDAPVSAPGGVTVLIVFIHLGAAATAAWAVWPFWVAVGVTALCITVVFTEQTRWEALNRSRR